MSGVVRLDLDGQWTQLINDEHSMNDEDFARHHCPVLHMHEKETSHVCSGPWLVAHSGIIVRETGVVEFRNATDQCMESHNNKKYSLDPCSQYLQGEVTTGLDQVPFYWTSYEEDGMLHLQYIFMYANNPGYSCGLGRHKADIEHVTLQFAEDRRSIQQVYFSAHGHTQGMWVKGGECEYTDDNRLKVYAALGSHACYPHAKTYWRIMGLTNDVCSNSGLRVHATADPVVEKLPDAVWTKWKGKMGPGGVSSVRRQGWFEKENGVTATIWWRLFGCCMW